MAYQSNRTGRFEIYLTPYPDGGQETAITSGGGTEPVWGKDGELFYRNNDRYMAVPVVLGATASAGEPRLLFAGKYLGTATYSRARDRFLMIRENSQEGAGKSLNLVLGWFDDLASKVP